MSSYQDVKYKKKRTNHGYALYENNQTQQCDIRKYEAAIDGQ